MTEFIYKKTVIIVTSSQHLSSQNDNLFSRRPWSLLPTRNISRLRMIEFIYKKWSLLLIQHFSSQN